MQLLLEREFGRPFQADEFGGSSAEGEELPKIIINLPCSPAQLEGHTVVTGFVQMEPTGTAAEPKGPR